MSNRQKRADIQVLRAISVIAVLIYHLDPRWLTGGYLGVDVFFVISGYLITGILLRQGDSISLKEFFQRRIARLFPALAVVLFFVLIGTVCVMQPVDYLESIRAIMYAAAQCGNLYFIQGQGYFAGAHDTNPLLHTWSLGVEEQFYLIFSIIFFLLVKKGRLTKNGTTLFASLALISFVLDFVLKWIDPPTGFYLPFTRSWELLAGSLLAIRNQRKPETKNSVCWTIGVSIIFLTLVLGSSSSYFDTLGRLAACMGTLLCLKFTAPFTHPGFRPLIYVGDISYSLYLWHWPVICFSIILGYGVDSLYPALTISGLSLFLAILSFHFIERRSLIKTASPPFRYKTVFAMVAIGLTAIFLEDSKKSHWRVTPSFPDAPITANNSVRHLDPLMLEGKSPQDCLLQNTSKKAILIIGDSHAQHFLPTISGWAESTNYSIETFSRPSTLSFSKSITYREIDPDLSVAKTINYQREADFLSKYLDLADYVTHLIIAHRTALYVSDAAPADKWLLQRGEIENSEYPNQNSKEAFQSTLSSFVADQDKENRKVILISQTPPIRMAPNYQVTILDKGLHTAFDKPLPRYSNHDLVLENDLLDRLTFEFNLYNSLSELENVIHFPTRNYIQAPIDPNGTLLYRDDDHLNRLGAEALIPHFKKFLDSKGVSL